MLARNLAFFISLLLLSNACSSDNEETCVEQPEVKTPVDVKVQDFQKEITTIETKAQLVDFFTRNPVLRDYVFLRPQYPHDSAFINTIFQRITNPHFDSLATETDRVFGDGSALRNELNEAFSNLKAYYPEITTPTIQTAITGLETDLFMSDTLIVIGLDFYLGGKGKYRPNMYDYILRQYIPENIVPSIMLLYGIDTRINVTDLNDRTVLADMIAYGKAFHFAKRMLPCKPDSIFLGYTAKETEGALENQDLIWYRLVEDKVLYATGNQLRQRYLGDRPKTVEVGPECPGKIGQWVGWQIVNSYRRNNPEISLQQLMQTGNPDKLFKESKYKANRK